MGRTKLPTTLFPPTLLVVVVVGVEGEECPQIHKPPTPLLPIPILHLLPRLTQVGVGEEEPHDCVFNVKAINLNPHLSKRKLISGGESVTYIHNLPGVFSAEFVKEG